MLPSSIKVKIIAFSLCTGVQKLTLGFVLLLAVGLELAVWYCSPNWGAGTPYRGQGVCCGTVSKTCLLTQAFVLVVLRFVLELINKDLA